MLHNKKGIKAFFGKIQRIFPTMVCDQAILFIEEIMAPMLDEIAISGSGARAHDQEKAHRKNVIEEFFTPLVVLEQDKKEPRLFRLAMYVDSVEPLHEDDDPALVNKHFLVDKLESEKEAVGIIEAFMLNVHSAVVMDRKFIHSCTKLKLDKLTYATSDSITVTMVGYMYDTVKEAISEWNATEDNVYGRHQAAAMSLAAQKKEPEDG